MATDTNAKKKDQPLATNLAPADLWQLTALTERLARIDRDKRLIFDEEQRTKEQYEACVSRICADYQLMDADKVNLSDGIITRAPIAVELEPQALRPVG